MVTATQISNYMISIYEALSIYADELTTKEKLGHKSLTETKIISTLLTMYVDIMTEYFSQATYDIDGYFDTDYNFFEPEEIQDIMLRINLICDTNYYLDLE